MFIVETNAIGCDVSLPRGPAGPALTTVDSSSRTLGAFAAASVLDPDAPPSATVQTRLIVRDSTGPVVSSTGNTG
ncbi:hypothetical protein [Rathayibacter soli]|uniref:hypothetical protein n=1 Tax=Rathayibacter soli TaxID=3144168 RepID=UPI0027E48566|nr:hypothetical protein [Glaciibacter superstes]